MTRPRLILAARDGELVEDISVPTRAPLLVAELLSAPRKAKPAKPQPVAIVRADRPNLTCLTCDEPAPYRIASNGVLGASACQRHKFIHRAAALRALDLKPPARRRKPKRAAPVGRPPHLCEPSECQCLPTRIQEQKPLGEKP
jgi:hypothetical protein